MISNESMPHKSEVAGQEVLFSEGSTAIQAERERQVFEEGYTPARDLHEYAHQELLQAAIAYAWHALGMSADDHPPITWPWPRTEWKPGSPVRDLEKAGALIAAQIDRLLAEGAIR